ncbi:hypothetical protein [Pseudomonas sp. A-R-19]|uniref:hypothetical protein n=1 Tax=Pseudomonas sp. A-R-19 TaxID=2832403 RepID=UPI001CBC93EA|nr:hypothetical protein [Pseudomonas sp. A-R-19]
MNLFEGHPEFTPDLINRARRIAKTHGYRILKPHGRMSLYEWGLGAFRLIDAEGNIAAGDRHQLTPRDVARHFGEIL